MFLSIILDIDHVPIPWRDQVRAMVAKTSHMWDEKLGRIEKFEHCIDLVPGTMLIH